jgi:hypothetical protein
LIYLIEEKELVMQIIGRNLPQLQNVVTSGLDSITQGLVQNSSAVAAQGLTNIKDSFQAAGLNATTLNPASSVQPEAGFQSPGSYFNRAAPDLSEKFTAMSAALTDPNLRPESMMGNFAGSLHDLNSKIASFDSPGAQQGTIIIGGRFQPGPPPIDVLGPDGPPIEPQLNADQRTALAIGGIFTPTPPPIVPQGVLMPEPPPIRIGDQLLPDPPPIRGSAEVFSPQPPPIMPNDIFQSQLQALGDMETTVKQTANLYQQLNSSMQLSPIIDTGIRTGNSVKAGQEASKQAAADAENNGIVDFTEDYVLDANPYPNPLSWMPSRPDGMNPDGSWDDGDKK